MDDSNNMEIYNLLTEWKLQHLYDKFKEENITVNTLKVIQPHHIKKLFLSLRIGDQVDFEFNLKNWKKIYGCDEEVQQSALKNTEDSPRTGIKRPFPSVSNILSSTKVGKDILQFYEKNHVLQEDHRALLLNIITKYLEVNDCECSLSECAEIEKQICKIFPSEDLSFYTNGKRGKLYNKLANLKRLSKEIFKGPEVASDENFKCEPSDDYALLIQCLRNENTSNADFDLYWRKCAAFRFKQIFESKSTSEIFALWPEYKKPAASQLIHIDFSLKYPNAKRLKDMWPKVGDSILNILTNKCGGSQFFKELQKAESSNEESKTLTTLWHTHKLFPPQQSFTTIPSGEKIRKRFSVADSQESFAIIAATTEEMEAKLKLLQLQGRNIQPRLLIVGHLHDIKKIFIYFDGLKLPYLTILDAFDILFKIFFVFNLHFPQESEVFYTFAQSILYELPTSKKFTKVAAVKHELFKM